MVLILYLAVVFAAAAAVLTEYRRYELSRLIKAGLGERPNKRPNGNAVVAPLAGLPQPLAVQGHTNESELARCHSCD
jgi:hypothetical protein